MGLAVAGLAFLAACDSAEEPLGPGPGGQLSASETTAVSQEIVQLAFDGWDFGQATASYVPRAGEGVSMSVAGAPITIDWTLSVSTACDQGGTVGVSGVISGSIDDQTFAGNLQLDVTTSMNDCAFLADEQVFTFNTNPDLQLSGSTAWDANGLVGTSTYTYVGGLDWAAADGRSGSCAVDVLVSLSSDGTEVVTGTICGASVDGSGSL